MYHSASLLRATVTASFLAVFSQISCWSTAIASTDATKDTGSNAISAIPLRPPASKLKNEPTSVEIYQYDKQPLGMRQPLLLVHGLRGEFYENFRWTKLSTFLADNKDFNQHYKIFLARWDTHDDFSNVVPAFKQALSKLYSGCGNTKLTVMALSMGGNAVQEAMEDPSCGRMVDRVLSLGSPFHGSPLFCADWMQYSMLKRHIFPWVKLDTCIPYRIYFNHHLNLLSDMRWDDADKQIPDVGPFSERIPLKVSGDLTPATMGNPHILKVNKLLNSEKGKFITYGGYLLGPWTGGRPPTVARWVATLPYRFITNVVPEHVGREHSVLRSLNFQIAAAQPRKSPVGTEYDGKKPMYPYGMNDGISPLSSSLFLPESALAKEDLISPGDLSKLKERLDVGKARVFRDIDHLTFIDGYHPIGSPAKLQDELSPSESPRPIFHWILTDLLEGRDKPAMAESASSVTETKTPESASISD
jgi:hypothetical protein